MACHLCLTLLPKETVHYECPLCKHLACVKCVKDYILQCSVGNPSCFVNTCTFKFTKVILCELLDEEWVFSEYVPHLHNLLIERQIELFDVTLPIVQAIQTNAPTEELKQRLYTSKQYNPTFVEFLHASFVAGDDEDDIVVDDREKEWNELCIEDCEKLCEIAKDHNIPQESMSELQMVCYHATFQYDLIANTMHTMTSTSKRIHDIRIDYLLGNLTKKEWTREFMECYEVISVAYTRRIYLSVFANSVFPFVSHIANDLMVNGGLINEAVDSVLHSIREYRVYLIWMLKVAYNGDVQQISTNF